MQAQTGAYARVIGRTGITSMYPADALGREPFPGWPILELAPAVPHPHGAGVARIELRTRPHDTGG
ncbi:hypothetical protein BZM27_22375 [Paraburkholderia steynii]|uniref:Uncharacterized protein n=1 Tax=Paraburkholderia steynii TaxID=1245441 RepID=A0A4V2NH09_9BURK|nr:hypothetical protein BZM27_22375 [Paraburkholderia steynii]